MTKKENLKDIKLKDFKECIIEAIKGKHTNIAPLGVSGDDIIIHDKVSKKTSRCQQISVRLYCGDVELLITNNRGSFLFYGRYDLQVCGVEFITKEYYRIFKILIRYIPLEYEPKDFEFIDEPRKSWIFGCRDVMGILRGYF